MLTTLPAICEFYNFCFSVDLNAEKNYFHGLCSLPMGRVSRRLWGIALRETGNC